MSWINCTTWNQSLSLSGLSFLIQLCPSQSYSKPQRYLPVNGALAESRNRNVGGCYHEKPFVQ